MPGLPPLFRRVTRARGRVARTGGAVSLGVAALVAAPLISSTSSVAVAVDGDLETFNTSAATVGEMLEGSDFEVAAADKVVPSRSTPVADGVVVQVVRATTVTLVVDDGPTRTVTAPVDTVDGILEAVALGDAVTEGAAVSPGPRADVEDGTEIRVRFPKPYTIEVDDEHLEGETLAADVGQLLAVRDIEVDDRDEVSPDLDAVIDGPTQIDLARVDIDETSEEVTIPHGEQRRETDDLYVGETRVLEAGSDGVRRVTYRVRTVDGERDGRKKLSAEVVTETQPRVVAVGTAQRPEPEPDPEPDPEPEPRSVSGNSVWDRLAACESGGNWSINTGNGYYGGLQFSLSTWRSVGGNGYPHEASRAEQINRGKILQSRSGWGQWPHCSRQLGLR